MTTIQKLRKSQDIIASVERMTIMWTYCNMSMIISMCAGVGGGWRRIVNINIAQEMIVRVSGGRPHNLVLASVE